MGLWALASGDRSIDKEAMDAMQRMAETAQPLQPVRQVLTGFFRAWPFPRGLPSRMNRVKGREWVKKGENLLYSLCVNRASLSLAKVVN
jgi:hypothetical protein